LLVVRTEETMKRGIAPLIAALVAGAVASVPVGLAATPKPVKVRSGLFSGKNPDGLSLTALVRDNHRTVLFEFKANLTCPPGVKPLVSIDTAIDRRSRIGRRGGFIARGPDEDLRGPFKSTMRISGRFTTPTRARGTYRLLDRATGCDSGVIPFRLRYEP